MKEVSTPVGNPDVWFNFMYMKDSNSKLYKKESTWVEKRVEVSYDVVVVDLSAWTHSATYYEHVSVTVGSDTNVVVLPTAVGHIDEVICVTRVHASSNIPVIIDTTGTETVNWEEWFNAYNIWTSVEFISDWANRKIL